jgi:hypothetical protein
MPLRCFASLFFAIAAALALALVAPKETFRRLAGGAVAWAAAVAGVAPAFSTAAVVPAAAGEITVAVASPLTASATAAENIQKIFLIFSCDNCDKFDF